MRTVRSNLAGLLDPDADPAVRAGRLCALFYLSGSIALLFTSFFLPKQNDRAVVALASLLGVAVSLLMLRLPWASWSEWTPFIFMAAALIFLGVAGRSQMLFDLVFLGVLPLPFIYCGLVLPPGAALKLAPIGALSFVLAEGWSDAAALTGLLIALPLSVLAAEILASAMRSRDRARAIVTGVLDTIQRLTRATREEEIVEIVEHSARQLLRADVAVVCDALDAATPLEARHAMETGQPVFVADVTCDDAAAPEVWCGEGGRATSAMFAPIPIPRGSGIAVAVGWANHRTRVRDEEQRALALMLSDAAQAIERVRSTSQLAVEAETDSLTNLANRRSFARALERVRMGDAVVLIDVDDFKSVNDEHGHAAGDELLRQFAQHLREVARKGDCVARYGGDELALILADVGDIGADAAVSRLHRSWRAVQPLTTFSAGIAVNLEGESPAGTLGRADEALYAAKAGGRNRCELAVDHRRASQPVEVGNLDDGPASDR